MDTLTFASPILLRHLTFSEAKKLPISEINLEMALKELDMDMDRVSLSVPLMAVQADFSLSNSAFYSDAITSNHVKVSDQRPLSNS
jgi:hypothetical protein